MNGIYQYRDLKTDEIVYIGKDSHIHKNARHIAHHSPCKYNDQQINRVLQNNTDRYQYEIIYSGDYSEDVLNTLEINTIEEFKMFHGGLRPKFNFTDGGDGSKGNKWSDERRIKFSESIKGWKMSDEEKQRLSELAKGRRHSEETRKKISKAQKGKIVSDETRKNMSKAQKGRIVSDEAKQKLKEVKTLKYYRLIKAGRRRDKQQYKIVRYGKAIRTSIDKEKLLNSFFRDYPLEIIKVVN